MRPQSICVVFVVTLIATTNCQNDDEEVTVETVVDDSEVYESPKPLDTSKVYFHENFDDQTAFDKKWIKSEAKKDGIEEDLAKYNGEWLIEPPQKDGFNGDLGMVLKSKAKHSAISAPLLRPFEFKDKPLIVQYEVTFQDGQECGGAYMKLISKGASKLNEFHDKTPYSIMFGPDKCGTDHKLHFIFNHKNPKNGSVEEKHCEKPEERLEEHFSDKLPHLYTLFLRPDNTFDIQVDKKTVKTGSLLEDFTPAVNPPAEIEDPDDKKPTDWDEREKIPDPTAVKPDDWDEDAPAQIVDESAIMPDGWLVNEPTHIPDPKGEKPADWDTDMDGEWEPALIENPTCESAPGCGPWEPPLINNPAFKGKWRPPMIENPNYKGKWNPRKIANPNYFEDTKPFQMQPISAIGFELWAITNNILFDNIIITEEYEVAEHWAANTFDKKRQKIASQSKTVWGKMMKSMNYNPGAWAMYFIYCSIPVESVVQKLANLTIEYPYLWAVYILVLAIPVVLLLYFVCKPSSRAQEAEEKSTAQRKKTDEPAAGVVEEQEEEEVEEEGQEVAPEAEDEDAEKNSNPDSEDDAVEEESEKPSEAGDGARKRKVRKD